MNLEGVEQRGNERIRGTASLYEPNICLSPVHRIPLMKEIC